MLCSFFNECILPALRELKLNIRMNHLNYS